MSIKKVMFMLSLVGTAAAFVGCVHSPSEGPGEKAGIRSDTGGGPIIVIQPTPQEQLQRGLTDDTAQPAWFVGCAYAGVTSFPDPVQKQDVDPDVRLAYGDSGQAADVKSIEVYMKCSTSADCPADPNGSTPPECIGAIADYKGVCSTPTYRKLSEIDMTIGASQASSLVVKVKDFDGKTHWSWNNKDLHGTDTLKLPDWPRALTDKITAVTVTDGKTVNNKTLVVAEIGQIRIRYKGKYYGDCGE